MLSYREHLGKIGVPAGAPISYQRDFATRPRSLRDAIRAMLAPASPEWAQVSDIFRDHSWTDEVRGVAWDGAHWIFSANANQDQGIGAP
jgi:hypothetical protein